MNLYFKELEKYFKNECHCWEQIPDLGPGGHYISVNCPHPIKFKINEVEVEKAHYTTSDMWSTIFFASDSQRFIVAFDQVCGGGASIEEAMKNFSKCFDDFFRWKILSEDIKVLSRIDYV